MEEEKRFDLSKYRESDQEAQMKAELAEYDRQIAEIRKNGGNIKSFIKVKLLERLGGINYLANFIMRYEADLKEKIVDLFVDDSNGGSLSDFEEGNISGRRRKKGQGTGNVTFNIGSMIKAVAKEEVEKEPKMTEIVAEEDKPIDVVVVKGEDGK